jgi:hypothetical protein
MQDAIYISFVILCSFIFFYKFGFNKISFLVFLIFWQGLFDYAGGIVWDSYKVCISIYQLLLVLMIFDKNVFYRNPSAFIFYLVFLISFIITHIINPSPIITVLSQLFFKYSSVIYIYIILIEIFKNLKTINYLKNLLVAVSFFQIFLSFIKIIIYGLIEQNVGSVEFGSGGMGVTLPLSILIFFSVVESKSSFKFKNLIKSLPLIIGFASIKRTPVIIYPILYFFLEKSNLNLFKRVSFIKYSPLLILLFIVGVKSNRTLNPENIFWGSFDLDFLFNYILNYSFGVDKIGDIGIDMTTRGRGGSFFLLFNLEKLGLFNFNDILFGNGIKDQALALNGRFLGGENYGIDHIGLMSAGITFVYSIGLAGVLSFILVSYAVINNFKCRLKKITIILFMFDLFIYGGQLFLINANIILIQFSLFYKTINFKQIN